MLIRFSVENFLSFKGLTEFSMVAGKMTRHSGHIATCNNKRMLKGAFIFGANASGKTNLIRAIAFARILFLMASQILIVTKNIFELTGATKSALVFSNLTFFRKDIFIHMDLPYLMLQRP